MGKVTHIKLTPEMKTAFDSPGVAARSVPIQPADRAPGELGDHATVTPHLRTDEDSVEAGEGS